MKSRKIMESLTGTLALVFYQARVYVGLGMGFLHLCSYTDRTFAL